MSDHQVLTLRRDWIDWEFRQWLVCSIAFVPLLHPCSSLGRTVSMLPGPEIQRVNRWWRIFYENWYPKCHLVQIHFANPYNLFVVRSNDSLIFILENVVNILQNTLDHLLVLVDAITDFRQMISVLWQHLLMRLWQRVQIFFRIRYTAHWIVSDSVKIRCGSN